MRVEAKRLLSGFQLKVMTFESILMMSERKVWFEGHMSEFRTYCFLWRVRNCLLGD